MITASNKGPSPDNKAITWNNVNLSSVVHYGILLSNFMGIAQDMKFINYIDNYTFKTTPTSPQGQKVKRKFIV